MRVIATQSRHNKERHRREYVHLSWDVNHQTCVGSVSSHLVTSQVVSCLEMRAFPGDPVQRGRRQVDLGGRE